MESYGVIWRFVLTRLDELTTLRLGGPIRRIEHAKTACELIDAVRSADAAGEPLLIVGGGSNLVAADAGWDGVVVLVESTGVDVQRQDDTVCVTAQAGVVWDEMSLSRWPQAGPDWRPCRVSRASPGDPVQDVRAYGSEVADSIVELQVLDRNDGVVRPASRSRAVRLRVPDERLQAHRPFRGTRGHVPAAPIAGLGPSAIRRAGPPAGHRAGPDGVVGRGPRRRPRARVAARACCSTPQITTPGASARSS